jgi:hypothetical protein
MFLMGPASRRPKTVSRVVGEIFLLPLIAGDTGSTTVPMSQTPHPRTCILVCGFDRQLAAAQLTLRLIDRYWRDHPEMWLCGVSIDDPVALPLRDDPADWMAVTRSAVRDLAAMGFERVFLIMADLGPMDRCHDQHLNQTIPNWMTELDAVYISLRGWDHRRNSRGESLGRRYMSLQRQLTMHWGRFSLDPALWRIDVLAGILDILTNENPERHSAWAFEQDAGRLHEKLPAAWNERTYRVCGRLMSVEPIPTLERWARHGFDGLIRWTDKTFNHKHRRKSLPPKILPVWQRLLMTNAVYYQGPYPMHFAGFLVRGVLNPELVDFLQRSGRHDLLQEIKAAVPSP